MGTRDEVIAVILLSGPNGDDHRVHLGVPRVNLDDHHAHLGELDDLEDANRAIVFYLLLINVEQLGFSAF